MEGIAGKLKEEIKLVVEEIKLRSPEKKVTEDSDDDDSSSEESHQQLEIEKIMVIKQE